MKNTPKFAPILEHKISKRLHVLFISDEKSLIFEISFLFEIASL